MKTLKRSVMAIRVLLTSSVVVFSSCMEAGTSQDPPMLVKTSNIDADLRILPSKVQTLANFSSAKDTYQRCLNLAWLELETCVFNAKGDPSTSESCREKFSTSSNRCDYQRAITANKIPQEICGAHPFLLKPSDQPDTYREAFDDTDTDRDGVTDHEEYLDGTDPCSKLTFEGVNDYKVWQMYFTSFSGEPVAIRSPSGF